MRTYRSHESGHWVLGILLCALGACVPLLALSLSEDDAWWPALGIGTALAALAAIGALRVFGFDWQSAPVAYLGFLWFFHFPLTLFVHLIPALWMQLPGQLYGWTQRPAWYSASIYSLMCVLAFTVGCGTAAKTAGARMGTRWTPIGTESRSFAVGVFTALAGNAVLYYILFYESGGDVFGEAYGQLFGTVFGSVFTFAIFIVATGCSIALLSAPRKLLWVPFVLQVVGSAPVLLTGARQFALVGPLVLFVLMARRGLRLGLVLTVASCLAGLWVISYVGAARGHGVLAGDTGTQAIGPVSAMAEMGGSLETASLAVEWAQNGDPFVQGGGYWLPFERALGAVFPYLRHDLDADPRAMGNLLLSRAAGLGGSAVAESYYNFGVFGISFFLVLGYLLGRMEIRADSPIAGAWLGVVLYVFVFQARNWFIGVPAMLFLGSLPVLACYALEWTARRRLLSLRAVAA